MRTMQRTPTSGTPSIPRKAVLGMALIVFVAVADAGEYEYALMNCASGTTTLLSQTADMTILSSDVKGIAWSTHPTNKAFDRMTYHCVGILRTGRAGSASHSYCKYMDPDGDITTGEA